MTQFYINVLVVEVILASDSAVVATSSNSSRDVLECRLVVRIVYDTNNHVNHNNNFNRIDVCQQF